MSSKYNNKKRIVFVETDKQLLVECFAKHEKVLNDKKTYGYVKWHQAWEAIVTAYNASQTGGPKTMNELKIKYANMKFLRKKELSNNKEETSDRTREQSGKKASTDSKSVFGNFAECSSNVEFQQENCYVCNEKLTSCRTKLSYKTKLTSTAIYEILESFTGVELDPSIRNDSLVCHECFVSFTQYDKWQHKSSELQRKMSQMHRDIRPEVILIKQEPNFDFEDDDDYSDEANDDSEEDWWTEEPSPKHQRPAQNEPEGFDQVTRHKRTRTIFIDQDVKLLSKCIEYATWELILKECKSSQICGIKTVEELKRKYNNMKHISREIFQNSISDMAKKFNGDSDGSSFRCEEMNQEIDEDDNVSSAMTTKRKSVTISSSKQNQHSNMERQLASFEKELAMLDAERLDNERKRLDIEILKRKIESEFGSSSDGGGASRKRVKRLTEN